MTAPSPNASAFYDRVWNHWGHLDDHSPAAFHRRRILIRLAKEHAPAARRILEVGTGQGALLQGLSTEFPAAELHGSDVSEQSLARARANCKSVNLFLLDLESATFASHAAHLANQFDLVICSEVLEHLHDDQLALERLASLLAPRGRLVVSVPGGDPTRFDRAIGHLRHYTEQSLSEKLRAASFCDLSIFAWGFPFHSFYRWVVKWAARASLDGAAAARSHTSLLSHGYAAFASAMKPLYYLNRRRGPQLFAVASASTNLR